GGGRRGSRRGGAGRGLGRGGGEEQGHGGGEVGARANGQVSWGWVPMQRQPAVGPDSALAIPRPLHHNAPPAQDSPPDAQGQAQQEEGQEDRGPALGDPRKQIGRASCRERAESAAGGAAVRRDEERS